MFKEFTRGLFRENPILVLSLGLCPLLAASVSAGGAVAMSLAFIFVIVGSNLILSSFGFYFPKRLSFLSRAVVVASFASIADICMVTYFPHLAEGLGIYIALLATNCAILMRVDVASRSGIMNSVVDGIGTGLGFSLALCSIAFIRELFGSGTIFGIQPAGWYSGAGPIKPMLAISLAPGAFIVAGLLMALVNWRRLAAERKARTILVGKRRLIVG